jgi:hypothetical protein
MAVRKALGSTTGGPGYDESEKFDPTREAMELNVLLNDPNVKHDAFVYPNTQLNSIGTRNYGNYSSPGRFSKRLLRRWIAKNVWQWFRERKIDPGIGVRSVTQQPGFGIKFDIEISLDVKGSSEDNRIVVEEVRPKTFLINIIPIANGAKREPVPKSSFDTIGHSSWTRLAVLSE